MPGGALAKDLSKRREHFGALAGKSRGVMIVAGFLRKKGDNGASSREVPVESFGSHAREPLKVIAGSNVGQVASEDGGGNHGIGGCEIVDCKACGLEPSGKMTTSRVRSCILISSHVSSVCGCKRTVASFNTSLGGRRQIRQVDNRERRLVMQSHEGTEPLTNRLRQSASSLSLPGM